MAKADFKENHFGIVLHQSQCSNNCVFCKGKKIGNIEKNIEQELDKIESALRMGEKIDSIEISGNDPGEYEELPDFVSLLRAKTGVSEIILATHGRNLSDRKFLEKIIKSGVNHFTVPFYGHTSKIHDSITRAKGSFKETCAGVRNIYELKKNVSFRSLITRENQRYLEELFYFLSRLPSYKLVCVGVPYYAEDRKDFVRSIPDFLKLRVQLSKALKLCQLMNFNIQLLDIPRCFIKLDYENSIESEIPQKAYEYLNGKKISPLRAKGRQITPGYRKKKKIKLCKKCIYNESCSGFFKTYVDSSLFPFKPILKKEN